MTFFQPFNFNLGEISISHLSIQMQLKGNNTFCRLSLITRMNLMVFFDPFSNEKNLRIFIHPKRAQKRPLNSFEKPKHKRQKADFFQLKVLNIRF